MGESIVVGTDGSDTAKRAVQEAVRLAKALDASVHVVSSYEPLRGAHVTGASEGDAKIYKPLPDSQVDAILEEAGASVRLSGVSCETHASREPPADAILEIAGKIGAKMIIVGNQGMHGAKRFVLGSVPNKVAHRAPCDVLIVSTDAPKL